MQALTKLGSVSEVTKKLLKERYRSLLQDWEKDAELAGGLLVNLIDPKGLEIEVRQAGKAPELSVQDFRSILLAASESAEPFWECKPNGVAYTLRFGEDLLGFCILFPASGTHRPERWADRIASFSRELGLLLQSPKDVPPSLHSLAEAIVERDGQSDSPAQKLHWEHSKARVDIPVQEELAVHLLLDHLPLF